jgi:anti-sigma factor RsiW
MMTHEEAIDFLATYALDAVDAEERAQIEEHLAECPRCRTELDAFREVTTALGNSVEPLPDGLWTSIASRLPERHDDERPPMPRLVRGDGDDDRDGSGDAATGETAAASARAGLVRGRLAAAAAVGAVASVAAVVTVLAVSLVHADSQVSQFEHGDTGTVPGAVVSALETPGHQVVNLEGARHGRVAQFVLADGRGYLVSSSLPTLTADHTYQLWGIVDGRAISLGLLGQSPDRATFTLAGSPSASKLGITIEPAGGSVVPSRPMVAQGTV